MTPIGLAMNVAYDQPLTSLTLIVLPVMMSLDTDRPGSEGGIRVALVTDTGNLA